MLPKLLENYSVLNNKLHYVKNKLHSEGVAHIVSRNLIEKVLFRKCQKILEEAMQKNYLEKEMVDAGEFIDHLLDRLFSDSIVQNPFETLLADLNQCAACGYTKGKINKINYIEAKIWDTDRSDKFRLQYLIYGSFFFFVT